LQNACGNIPGFVAPWLTGWIVQTTGHYYFAFIAAGGACLFGSACFGLLVRESDRLPQNAVERATELNGVRSPSTGAEASAAASAGPSD
jgi:nitrate/nitrite transporter NarK